MLMTNQLIGFGVGGGSAATILNTGSVVGSGTDTTTVTFSAYPIGPASATRRVFACLAGDDGNVGTRTWSSCSIGGVSATNHVNINHNSGGSSFVAIFSAIVPTGTTADIVTTANGPTPRRALWAVAVDGLVNSVATDTGTGTAGSLSTTLTIEEGGFAIGVANTLSTGNNFTWTGIDEQVETVYDALAELGGAYLLTTSSSDISVTCTRSAGSRSSYAVLSFR